MAWSDEVSELKNAGFSDAEIGEEGARTRQEMTQAGFKQQEVDQYFGVKEPDLSPIKNMFKANLDMTAAEYKKLQDEGKDIPAHPDSILESFKAGFGQSSWAMMEKALAGKSVKPDMLLPEDASTFYRIASQVGTLAGDLPAMTAGTVIGGAMGSEVPIVGNVVGGGAGAFALPAAIRSTLTNYYEKGEIHDFQDFWERLSATMIDTTKEAAIGGATALVGGKVLTGAAAAMAPQAARIASVGAEVATMTTLGKAFQGQVPSAQDFLDGALLVGGLHVATSAPAKLREIYAKTGVTPDKVVEDAKTDPVLKQQLLSNSTELPDSYKPLVETSSETGSMKINGMDNPPAEQAPAEPTAQDKILSKIGEVADKQKPSYTKDDFYKDYIDKLDPINRAVSELANGEKISTDKNSYALSRMASDAPAKAQHFLEHGVLDYKTLETVGPSLKEIIDPVKDDIKGLEAYIVSKRAIELEGRGIQSGFDTEAAKTVVEEGKGKFEETAKKLVDFQNNTLKYLKDSGVISEEAYGKMLTANESYVSFKRIAEEGDSTSGGTKGAPVKKIKGSDLSIQRPIQSIIENVDLYTKVAEINRAKVAMVEQAESVPDQKVIEKVPTAMKPITVEGSEAAKALAKQGIEVDPESFTIFRKADHNLAADEFAVYRDGKREIYKTAEPALAEAFKTLDGNATAQNLVFKLMNTITGIKRIGISLTPDFMTRNWLRDSATASVFSESGKYNIMDVFSAMGNIVKKDEVYYNWLKAGGANGAFIDLGERYLKDNFYKMGDDVTGMDRVWNVLKTGVHYAEAAGTLLEQSTRLAEAKRVMGDATSGSKVFDAGMASREITVDFQRIGAKMSAWNGITAFQNAQIQGLDRTIRAVKSDPAGVTLKAMTAITVPSLLLWWANHDDERYKELPQWQKDNFWIFPTDKWEKETVPGEAASLPSHLKRQNAEGGWEVNKGAIFRIPKPQELGLLFGTIPERIMDSFVNKNPDAFKNFSETIVGLMTPSFIPDAILPVLEHSVNKSFFSNSAIVQGHMEQRLPQYQFTPYTSETAKALGKLIAPVPFIGDLGPKNTPLASPMVLDNYIRSWTGNLGGYALQIADAGLRKAGIAPDIERPEMSLGEMPIIKAFVAKYPNMQADSIQKFYETASENEKVLNTIKSLAKAGDVTESQKIMMDPDNMAKMQDLSGMRESLSKQSQLIQMIQMNPDMKGHEKRQLIDGLYYGMIETAKAGNKAAADFKETIRQQKEVAGEQ